MGANWTALRFSVIVFASTVLIGCGGGGGGGSTTSFGKPVFVSGDYGYLITDYNQNGNLIGSSAGDPQVGAYWQSLTSKPVQLQALPNSKPQTKATAVAININGEIVGYQFSPFDGLIRPLYWSGPSAVPVELKLDSNGGDCGCLSINDKGNIVGVDGAGHLAYWSSSSASPVDLGTKVGPAPAGLSPFSGFVKITNGGLIVSQSNISGLGLPSPTSIFVWQSPTSSASNVEIGGYVSDMNSSGLCVGSGIYGPTYWAPPTYTAKGLASPNGLPSRGLGPTRIGTLADSSLAVNDSGEVTGSFDSQKFGMLACYWPSITAQPVDLNSVTPRVNGLTLRKGLFILNSGTILGIGINGGQIFEINPTSGSAG